MDVFIVGFAYPKHKSGGAVVEAEKWSQNIIEKTKELPKVNSPCSIKVDYYIAPERFTMGSPYGPDLDNLTKRLLDALKQTILSDAEGEDGCVMDLRISKRVAKPGEQQGVRITTEPIREEPGAGEFQYFAYGSNMQYHRLKDRVGTLKKSCIAYLPNYKLRTNKRGDDGSGKANIERNSSSIVWGVLWSIPETSRNLLNDAEVYRPGRHDSHYKPIDIMVFDEAGTPWRAMAYVACQGRVTDNDLPVQGWYYSFIIDGAVENGLPSEHVDKLREIQVVGK